MATHKIAIVKGDGIGVDVVNEGMKVLDARAPNMASPGTTQSFHGVLTTTSRTAK